MCMTRSFIITKNAVLSLPKTDSHEEIIKANRLNDSVLAPDFVRVELLPTTDLEKLDTWEFRLDQDRLPDWWNSKESEIACREEFAKWIKSHGWKNIPGDLNLQNCKGLTKLPDQLCSVGGCLSLQGTAVKSLGSLQSVGGSLSLQDTAVKDLGSLQSVGGSLYLQGTAVKDLGSLQSVGGYLYLHGTAVKKLPKNLKVKEVIWQ